MNSQLQHITALSLSKLQQQQLESSIVGKELLAIFQKQALTPVFQPIIDVRSRSIFAHEALIRGPEFSFLYNPLHLLKVAEDNGCLFEVDWLARLLSIHSFQHQRADSLLFLNVTVNTLMQKTHRSGITLEYLQLLGIPMDQVVIEITELQPVDDFSAFVESVNHYREMGFKVAIDDLGAGYNGLRIWSEIRPDFVKIDHHFISNIHNDKDKYRFMSTICTLANSLGTKIVAEGVEEYGELELLEKLGVDYMQGFLFKRPQKAVTRELDFEWHTSNVSAQQLYGVTAEKIVQQPFFLTYWCNVMQMARFLFANPDISHIPVVINDTIQGMLWREQIMNHIAKALEYGTSANAQLKDLIDSDVVTIEIDTPIVDIAQILTQSSAQKNSAHFIVTDKGRYCGCGHLIDVMRALMDQSRKMKF